MSNAPASRRDILDHYRAEYGPEVGEDWRVILLDMAAMADGQGANLVRYGCEIASRMATRAEAIAVLSAVDGDAPVVRRVLGLV